VFFIGFLPVLAQSPHGETLKIDCAQCHNPEGWTINYETIQFDHSTTDFDLEGAHNQTDCKACHTSLVFSEVPTDCISCHVDVHSMSVGNDCMRCHSSQSWLVDNISEIHEENGFPLIGTHSNLSCIECHLSETDLRFDRVGNDCISCHREDYMAAQNPNHTGFSTNCIDCHSVLGMEWEADIINHDFFPLTLGHDLQNCSECHTTGVFSDANPDCVSCHQNDYTATVNPNHQQANIPTDCVSCHTTNPGWMPALFDHDATDFPLTGGHIGLDCVECHANGYSNTPTDCFACHGADYSNTSNPDHEAAGIPTDCVLCHTTNPGWTPAIFDHNNTDFPLTGAHIGLDCLECHASGYPNTPTDCFACHQADYDNTTNPDHDAAGIPTDCVSCHTTNPGWTPATFDHNLTGFPLTGAHIGVDCIECHASGYPSTPTDCFACHTADYNNSTNPNHLGAGFPTDCVTCHTTSPNWIPANFDHDGMYFPIYSGKHDNEWNQCIDCHISPSDYGIFTCVTCHIESETADQHIGEPGYMYESNACFACHPDP
jgi:hypothetical protein